MCADLLRKTKCLTQCLKNQSQLRWLALRPLVQMNHQTTSLALKGETKRSRLSLCRGASHLHFDIPSSFPCYSCIAYSIKSSLYVWYAFFFRQARHHFCVYSKMFHSLFWWSCNWHANFKARTHVYDLDSLKTWYFTEIGSSSSARSVLRAPSARCFQFVFCNLVSHLFVLWDLLDGHVRRSTESV